MEYTNLDAESNNLSAIFFPSVSEYVQQAVDESGYALVLVPDPLKSSVSHEVLANGIYPGVHYKADLLPQEDRAQLCSENLGAVRKGNDIKSDQELSLESVVTLAEDMERSPICNICHKEFKDDRNLSRHLKTHDVLNRKFICNICGWAFSRNSNLTTHYRTHTGERPFECQLCGKRFKQRGSLLCHQKTHSKVKPFICPLCGTLFSRKSSVLRHAERFHGHLKSQVGETECFLKNESEDFLSPEYKLKTKQLCN